MGSVIVKHFCVVPNKATFVHMLCCLSLNVLVGCFHINLMKHLGHIISKVTWGLWRFQLFHHQNPAQEMIKPWLVSQ